MYFTTGAWIVIYTLECQNVFLLSYHQQLLNLGDSLLVATPSHKGLGITVTSNVSWTAHYDQILSKAYKNFNFIHQTFKNYNFPRRHFIFHS